MMSFILCGLGVRKPLGRAGREEGLGAESLERETDRNGIQSSGPWMVAEGASVRPHGQGLRGRCWG